MVVAEASADRSGGGAILNRFLNNDCTDKPPPANALGILSFETAKTMSRLVSIYMSVTDDEIQNLKTEIVKSVGITYLNSDDEVFLLGLACSERLEDLNRAADAVARLGQRCSDQNLNRFDIVYANLKQGNSDSGKVLEFNSKSLEKIIAKLEKYVANTSLLFAEMEGLRALEVQERKIQQWKAIATPAQVKETNLDLFEQKIGLQRKEVRRLKKISLWNRTFEKCVGLMTRVVIAVYTRIRSVFGPQVSVLPEMSGMKGKKHHFHIHLRRNQKPPNRIAPDSDHCVLEHGPNSKRASKSGPLPGNTRKASRNRFWSHELSPPYPAVTGFESEPKPEPKSETGKTNLVYLSAPPTTVGGSGLASRYANVILMAERYLNSPEVMDDEERGSMYQMLPARLKAKLRTKLRSTWVRTEKEAKGGDGGKSLAAGWREAVEGMLEWLTPVAMDTLRWQAERNLEKQNMDSRPTVLLLQTLHYSDVEKTEAVMVEVLVGLSFIFKHENRQTLFQ